MQAYRSRIDAAVGKTRQQSIDLLKALVAASRVGEEAVQSLVRSEMERNGCIVEEFDYRPDQVPMVEEFAVDGVMASAGRSSVIGRLSGGGHRSLLLFAHPDTEPIAADHGWRRDPFEGAIVGGRLYGWGVADDLAGVAVMLQSARLLREAHLSPLGDIVLASTPSKRHARGIAALLHAGWTADAALYLHPAESGAGLGEIKAFCSGQLDLRITVTGRLPDTREPAHTGFTHLAVNPLDKAFVIYEALKQLDRTRGERVHHPLLENAVGRSTNIQIAALRCGEPATFSRLARTCVIGAAISFPPSETLETVQAEIEACIAVAAGADPWLSSHPPQLEWLSGVSAAEVPTEHSYYQVVAKSLAEVAGRQPAVNPMHTSSDIRNPIVQKNIPTVGFGPLCGGLTMAGEHDEWVDVEDYLRAVKASAYIIAEWCGVSEE